MFLTEYDEKKHMNAVYKEGYEEGEQAGERIGYEKGEQAGERNLLERKIRKKLQQGKGAAVIAEELDEEIAMVEEIISGMKHSS